MNLLDLIIIAFGVGAAVGGYRKGLLTNAGSWIGGGAGFGSWGSTWPPRR